jgi:hypothetical protein
MSQSDSDFADIFRRSQMLVPRFFPKIATRHHFMPGMYVLVEEVPDIYFVTSRLGISLWMETRIGGKQVIHAALGDLYDFSAEYPDAIDYMLIRQVRLSRED